MKMEKNRLSRNSLTFNTPNCKESTETKFQGELPMNQYFEFSDPMHEPQLGLNISDIQESLSICRKRIKREENKLELVVKYYDNNDRHLGDGPYVWDEENFKEYVAEVHPFSLYLGNGRYQITEDRYIKCGERTVRRENV